MRYVSTIHLTKFSNSSYVASNGMTVTMNVEWRRRELFDVVFEHCLEEIRKITKPLSA
jgi:hypothetical protein